MDTDMQPHQNYTKSRRLGKNTTNRISKKSHKSMTGHVNKSVKINLDKCELVVFIW